jgi:hypothetical protein
MAEVATLDTVQSYAQFIQRKVAILQEQLRTPSYPAELDTIPVPPQLINELNSITVVEIPTETPDDPEDIEEYDDEEETEPNHSEAVIQTQPMAIMVIDGLQQVEIPISDRKSTLHLIH